MESRYSGVLEGWLEDAPDDDHHDEHTLELTHVRVFLLFYLNATKGACQIGREQSLCGPDCSTAH